MEVILTRYGKRPGGPWYGEDFPRIIFEKNVQLYFPGNISKTKTSGHDAGRYYQLNVNVPHYDKRKVQILFKKDSPTVPRVTVDGPTESKHRYSSGELCMWYPQDPPDMRWVFDDGLIALIAYIIAHLFREEWYRETGEWLGPEVSHPVL